MRGKPPAAGRKLLTWQRCTKSTTQGGPQRGGTRWSSEKPHCICHWTIVCRLAVGRAGVCCWCTSVGFTTVPAGRGRPAAHGTWSSQSAKQPSPRCSRNDPRTLLIALSQDGLGQPSRLSKLLSGPKTVPAACHVAAPRLAAGAAHARPERRAERPTD